ncbi:glycoside hydrolase family 2 TIM barrel-domain containing protein [Leifsonia sp. F6_8S_P_1B]|uniref:Glycoside hydrolase family 2 TIM barrel-domain containing protein n=1 Tax=Leifsonia williamsii TaxID=3035919 RepID=A0ABT8K8M4_9MICO|nr:glycoside hydrolase family 2 TIM barrel-domain containing protein [Leifsonia williamsii]MDN4613809.1 glycoside hydrolase family 2 TIM barrel-domain containing protein [Leifsonia williamsii]
MVIAAHPTPSPESRTLFNDGWTVRPKVSVFFELGGAAPEPQPVTLPHDAAIGEPRDPAGSHDTGYFPGGAFQYEKTFEVPADWAGKHVGLEFEGVYRDAMVYINNRFAGHRASGYAAFRVVADDFLDYGATNTIRVECRLHQDARWYSGAGIYRDVWLTVQEPVHVAADGLVVSTPDVDDELAIAAVATTVENAGTRPRTVRVDARIEDADGAVVARATTPVTVLPGEPAVVRQRLAVDRPQRWSVDTPNLYRAVVTVADDDRIDVRSTLFGIRTLQLDTRYGLRINGEPVKLRGACIHHDNGPIGAAAIPRAEERRVELLKAAGFNAIRSAHNPISPAMLDACDRLGMLVMDEFSDVWAEAKTSFDYSIDFAEWWQRDVEAMVRKDINHPSVILYSIGNEIPETGDPISSVWSRRLAEHVRAIDSSRYVTNGVNPMVSVIRHFAAMTSQQGSEGGVNALMSEMNDIMGQISASELVAEATEESLAVLDVTGLNYGDRRYLLDHELFPNRITVGTETSPVRIAENWAVISEHANLLGDFTWTGWDYLGEAGLGRALYADEGTPLLMGEYPWLLARCGDIDITGRRRPPSYYREIVFGLRHEPYIAVRRPDTHGRSQMPGVWAWSESLASWDWDVAEGTPITVEVYSDADEIELILDGESIGRAAVGSRNGFRCEIDTVFRRGELVAIAYTDGRETARTGLRSPSDEVRLEVVADRGTIDASPSDLAYVDIDLVDADGVPVTASDRRVVVLVAGPAVLQGLASARPATEESFTGSSHTTYEGHAVAVVRPTGAGRIVVTVRTDDGLEAGTEIHAGTPSHTAPDKGVTSWRKTPHAPRASSSALPSR